MGHMTDCFWSVYNADDEVRIDGLRTVQVQSLLKTLSGPSGGIDAWLVWQEGTEEWKPAKVVHSTLVKETTLKKMPPIPPAVKGPNKLTEETAIFKSNSIDELTAGDSDLDSRMSPRFLRKLGVTVLLNGQTLANETVNVSVTGLKLKHPLPKDAPSIVNLKLHRDGHTLELICRRLRQGNERSLDRLMIESCTKADVLRSWILG
jgi:hypothetical protein